MGRVTAEITVTNRADEIRVSNRLIEYDEVRNVILSDVLVDTGATLLCLPADVIERLGLEYKETIQVETATGVADLRIFRDAHLEVCGRDDTFQCLELPAGAMPLLGQIPLEGLGLEPDLRRQRLRVLPMDEHSTYVTV